MTVVLYSVCQVLCFVWLPWTLCVVYLWSHPKRCSVDVDLCWLSRLDFKRRIQLPRAVGWRRCKSEILKLTETKGNVEIWVCFWKHSIASVWFMVALAGDGVRWMFLSSHVCCREISNALVSCFIGIAGEALPSITAWHDAVFTEKGLSQRIRESRRCYQSDLAVFKPDVLQ